MEKEIEQKVEEQEVDEQEVEVFDYEKFQEVFEKALENERLEQEEILKKELQNKQEEKEEKEISELEKYNTMIEAIEKNDNQLVADNITELSLLIEEQNNILDNYNKNNVEGFWLLSILLVVSFAFKIFFEKMTKW